MHEKIRNKQGASINVGQRQLPLLFVRRKIIAFLIIAVSFLPGMPMGETQIPAALANNQQGSNSVYLPLVAKHITTGAMPVIHVPFLDVADLYQDGFGQMAVTWFGKITRFTNSSDMRIGYNRQILLIDIASYDRSLWYDSSSPSASEVNNWDATSLYLRIPANQQHGEQYLRFDGQLSGLEARSAYQAAYRYSQGGWVRENIPFVTKTQWRGGAMNGDPEDRGWAITYEIPFASLGFSGIVDSQRSWGMGVRVFDRDWNEDGIATSQSWPAALDDRVPGSFGNITFGYPSYTPPARPLAGTLTIRQGSDTTVQDGTVGGYATCGGTMNYWTEWGNRVYDTGDESEVVNVQNQRDIADFPCFSRYYISFPIERLPKGKVILSAKLTLNHFGNSDPTKARPSYIQVFRIEQPWNESSLSWNTAPPPVENYPGTWVEPLLITYNGPDVPRTWDVTKALVDVYTSNQDILKLAMYSSDRAYHSGKYFRSSEYIGWSTTAVPTLTIQWGEP